jgi:hypothetical protein
MASWVLRVVAMLEREGMDDVVLRVCREKDDPATD